MTRTLRFLAVSLAGAMILVAGCSAKNGSSATLTSVGPNPEQPDITVAAIPAVDLVASYSPRDRGLYAHGISEQRALVSSMTGPGS